MHDAGYPDSKGDEDSLGQISIAGIGDSAPGTAVGFGRELCIHIWNLKNMGDTDGEGCVGWKGADNDAFKRKNGDP